MQLSLTLETVSVCRSQFLCLYLTGGVCLMLKTDEIHLVILKESSRTALFRIKHLTEYRKRVNTKPESESRKLNNFLSQHNIHCTADCYNECVWTIALHVHLQKR